MTWFWFSKMYESVSLDAVIRAATGRRMTEHIGVSIGGYDDLWTYLEYKALASSEATIFSLVAVVMGTVLVFWIRRSL